MYAKIYAILLSLTGIQLPNQFCSFSSAPDIGVQHVGIQTECGRIEFRDDYAIIGNDTLTYEIKDNRILWK